MSKIEPNQSIGEHFANLLLLRAKAFDEAASAKATANGHKPTEMQVSEVSNLGKVTLTFTNEVDFPESIL